MNGTPDRNCDIVMKGGITSGVVYPLVIVELAEEFRFKNIAGTSAGAIAAVVAGAAEYQRVEKQSDAGFRRMEKLPPFLGGKTNGESNLLGLFPPTPSTRQLFNLAIAFVGNDSKLRKAARVIVGLLLVSPPVTIASFLPLVLLLIFHRAVAGWLPVALIGTALLGFGFMVTIIWNVFQAVCFTLPRNRFGFSTGRTPADRKLPGVTDWLFNEIQETAGRTAIDPPLTFGELWLAGQVVAPETRDDVLERCTADRDLRSVNVQMVTTALTHGRPYLLPFEDRTFSFCEPEFREYFPAAVVNHMIAKTQQAQLPCPTCGGELYAMPHGWDIPLVVAARLSLSFPILFTLVPLYGVDYTYKVNQGAAPAKYERCWFIDGGLSSNMPMSLFDSPFPRWPTFGINLDEEHPQYPMGSDEAKNFWMIKREGDGRSNRWTHFPDRGLQGIGGYVAAMLDAIRNWHDNTQLAVPGFRDRVAHIQMRKNEGGLNLNMPDEVIGKLSARGRAVGRELRARFGKAGATRAGLNWNTHRWTRFRSSVALMQKAMRRIDSAFAHTDPAYPSYGDLLARTANDRPKAGYWWKKPATQQPAADAFVTAAKDIARSPVDLSEGAPKPLPELRITPRL
jgi:predicted acylesterase/phospholipase RssA